MMKSRLAVAALVIAGLASPTFAATSSYGHSSKHASMTKSYKHSSKHARMTKQSNAKSGVTTGANMKKSGGSNGSTGTTTKKGY